MSTDAVFRDPTEGLQFLAWAHPHLLTADSSAEQVLSGRDEVLDRFGPLFREESDSITEEDIRAFLSFEQNRHWSGLHRQSKNLFQNMDAVRKSIRILANRPELGDNVATRVDEAIKAVKGFGEGIVTPILYVSYPEHYGVWNAKTEYALRLLNLWPPVDRRDSKGTIYEHVNARLYYARKQLNRDLDHGDEPVDFWTIDYFWHALKVMHGDGRLARLIADYYAR